MGDELDPRDSADGIELSAEEMSAKVEAKFKAQREKRQRKLERKNSKHHVESSLDEFVAVARGEVNEVESFVPENREASLAKEIDELKQKLKAAEARIVERLVEEHKSAPKPPRAWLPVALAFAAGAAGMFAVSFAMRRNEPTQVAAPAADQPASRVEPLPTVEPIVTPPPPVETTPVPVEAAPVEPAKVEVAAKKKPLVKKPNEPKPTTEPPKKDDGLYNPF